VRPGDFETDIAIRIYAYRVIGGIRIGVVSALVVLAGLLLAACGSSPSTSSSTTEKSPSPSPAAKITSVDACSLVMASEASTATGATLTSSAAGGASIPGACIYSSSDSTASVVIFAQVYPDSTTAASVSPEQISAALNGAYGVANAKPVSGIGDKAIEYTLTGAQNGTVIFVFKSNVVLMIVVTPTPSSSTAVEGLARTAVGRLKPA
jgi:hypothetical protein